MLAEHALGGRKAACGDCFRVAGRPVMYGELPADCVLVHGRPRLTRPPHRRFDHAWVECGDVVIDRSNGRNFVGRREDYYRVGQIEEGQVRRYRREEAVAAAVEHRHWGPWPSG